MSTCAETECSLLGAILYDPSRAMPAANKHRVVPSDFSDSDNFLVAMAIRDLETAGKPIDIVTVKNHLMGKLSSQQLEALIDACPAPAHAEYYASEVKIQSRRRQLLSLMNDGVSRLTAGDDFTVQLQRMNELQDESNATRYDFPRLTLRELMAYTNDRSSYVAGEGWLRPGAVSVLTGGTGIGKSVCAEQLATCVASGIPFFGIQTYRPQNVDYFQAENDMGTLKRDFSSIIRNASGHPCPVLVATHLGIYHVYGLSGEPFYKFIESTLRKRRPELIVIDPIQSFLGGADINASETFLGFLGPLDALIKRYNCALLLVAHTPKPREREGWTARESVYMAAGSSVLSNWARTSCELTECKDESRFRLRFGKNAERTGLCDDSGGIIRDLFIQHSGSLAEPYWTLADDQSEPSKGKYDRQIKIYIAEHPQAKDSEVALSVGCDRSTAYRVRRKLLE